MSPRSKTETEAVVTQQVSEDTITDIQKILGAREDSQPEGLYSPQEQDYSKFLKTVEENCSDGTSTEVDFSFASWIRSLEESFEQYSIHPRELFPESPKKPSPRKQVAFSKDNTVRFFHRTDSELKQLKTRKKKHIKNNRNDVEKWPLFRYFDQKLKTIESFFIQENACSVQNAPMTLDEKLQTIENFFTQEKVCSCQDPPKASYHKEQEEPMPAVPMQLVSPKSLADDLVPDNENDGGNKNNVEVEPPKGESVKSNNSDRIMSNNSTLSDSSHMSGLWFAIPYKSPSSPTNDASSEFLVMDPTGFPVVNDSLLDVDLGISIISNESNGKNTSLNSFVSIARKQEMVEGAKRWAAAQQDFFDTTHEGLGFATEATQNTAETSRTSSPQDNLDLLDLQDLSPSPSLKDGSDLDESMDLEEERKCGTQESKEWEVAEFGPDLDESRGLRYHQEVPDLALSEEWESFDLEPIADLGAKATQKAANDGDWLPVLSTIFKPAVFQDAPDMDEAKGWKPFQEEETPKKTIESRYPSAPRKTRRQRVDKSRFHEVSLNQEAGSVEKEAQPNRVQDVRISKSVKELARAIELRMSPTNESVVSPLTVETWADDRKEDPAELPKLQLPVLDRAQPSPVSVTLS